MKGRNFFSPSSLQFSNDHDDNDEEVKDDDDDDDNELTMTIMITIVYKNLSRLRKSIVFLATLHNPIKHWLRP